MNGDNTMAVRHCQTLLLMSVKDRMKQATKAGVGVFSVWLHWLVLCSFPVCKVEERQTEAL